jgi:periplasmic copper chaperone A
MFSRLTSFPAALLLVLAGHHAQAHDAKVGALTVQHPYATPTPGVARNGAVYFKFIRNDGPADDRLVSASTPAAESVELHEMRMDGDVMRMRAVEAVPLPAGREVSMQHGQMPGLHLMLIGLKAPLKTGDRFPIRLRFQKAGEVEAQVWVEPAAAAASSAHGAGHKH